MGGRGETGRRSGLKIRFPDGSAGSSPAVRTIFLGVLVLLGSCNQPSDDGGIEVSVIGGAPRLIDPDRAPLARSDSELLGATAQGLVAVDNGGQIEPALAESWTFTKDGLSVIFRIGRAHWREGDEVTAAQVAASLNRAIAQPSRNALRPLLSSIESVVGMTNRVLEIRLRVPRPNLLQLLARPELGIRRQGSGSGPWRATKVTAGFQLIPVETNDLVGDATSSGPPVPKVFLRGERAGLAVARFTRRHSVFVTGGTLADWPIVQAAQVRAALIRVDPVEGLFGLAANPVRPIISDDATRAALAMAIDRDAMVTLFGVPRWLPIDRLLPTRLDSAQNPAVPEWSTLALEERQREARARIAQWEIRNGPLTPLRIALPDGPGMTLLFARLALDWRAIGVRAERVGLNAPDADFRLIDEVAPGTSANWYLTRTGCDAGLPCNREADAALKAARSAPTLEQRAIEIAKADAAGASFAAFIPLARPVRWSLVDDSLNGFRENR